MNLAFVDLEMNQPSEKIIQIGAVVFNLKSGKEVSFFDSFVNPGEPIDPFITTLTGITDEMVQVAPPIEVVLTGFWDWITTQAIGNKVCAWGEDMWFLKRVSTENQIQIPKLKDFNFKEMMRWFKSARGLPEKGGLDVTLRQFGLKFEGTPHNALHDARNTGRLGVHAYKIIRTSFQLQQLARELL